MCSILPVFTDTENPVIHTTKPKEKQDTKRSLLTEGNDISRRARVSNAGKPGCEEAGKLGPNGYRGRMNAQPGSYDGNTVAGGPAQTRLTKQLEITKLTVGPLGNNCYLLRCRRTGGTLLIDAAAEPDRILEMTGGRIDRILTTHGHHDHWGALAAIKQATGAETLAHPADAEMIGVPTDRLVDGGDRVPVGEVELEAVHLVGHSPGSLALIHRDVDGSTHVFSGDALFPDGVGNTWGDPNAFRSLLDGVTSQIFDRLPDGAWVYPGHGADTTLGVERPALSTWRARGW
ncbi:MAG: MBL fold metallo-hydrolase [Candidatus Nanopelagicales bacterium]|nr:MBL fold metallo-hydrolase [Candidatus Nanopelagicales bacterium]